MDMHNETLAVRAHQAGSEQPLTRHTTSSLTTDTRGIDPATAVQFAEELTPVLALVSGSSMSREDRKMWLNAAYRVVGHYPPDLLRDGCLKAMQVADHPSKIVPAIVKELEGAIERRRAVMAYREMQATRPKPIVPEETIEDNSPLPFNEIEHLPVAFLRLGLAKGWVRQQDYDRLIAKGEAA